MVSVRTGSGIVFGSGAGGSVMVRVRTTIKSSDLNGVVPVSISYSITPRV